MTTTLIPRESCWACPGRRPVGSDRCPGCGAPPRLVPNLLAAANAASNVKEEAARLAGGMLTHARRTTSRSQANGARLAAEDYALEAAAARLEREDLYRLHKEVERRAAPYPLPEASGPGVDGDDQPGLHRGGAS